MTPSPGFRERFRNLPIRRKLTSLMWLASGSGLLLAGLALIGFDWITARDTAERNLDSLARIGAEHSTAALAFRDQTTATETLAAYRAMSEIELACLYVNEPDGQPRLFARYGAAESARCPEAPGDEGILETIGDLSIVVPVQEGGDAVGWLRVQQTLGPLQQALTVQVAITLAILGAALLVTLAAGGLLQRLLVAPVLQLATVARHVSESKDYSQRAVKHSGDEVGQLAADFNQMLEQIGRREHELQRAEARMRSVVETAVDGIIVIDLTGTVEAYNPAAERIFGYAPAEVIGRNVKTLMPSPYQEEHDRYLSNFLESGIRKIIGKGREVEGRRKDGSTFPLELSVSEMTVGEERKFTGLVRDITERKEAEAELQRLNVSLESQNQETRQALDQLRDAQTQLVQSEKLASLGSLVAGIAHEINTPVGVGVTAASTLADRANEVRRLYESDAMKRSDLERFIGISNESTQIILKNLQRAADLIHSFKQVAVDQSSGDRRRFGLRGYLDEVLLSLAPRLKKTRHHVSVDCPAALTVDSYPGALAQIVTNLVSNSLVHAFADGEAGELRFVVEEQDGWTTLAYSDNGKGIPRKHLSRIYDPFFTTRRGTGGSGLGMHIVFNLVTQVLGGQIDVESDAGAGSRFTIRMPTVARKEAA